jgi:hypothetical protein
MLAVRVVLSMDPSGLKLEIERQANRRCKLLDPAILVVRNLLMELSNVST